MPSCSGEPCVLQGLSFGVGLMLWATLPAAAWRSFAALPVYMQFSMSNHAAEPDLDAAPKTQEPEQWDFQPP